MARRKDGKEWGCVPDPEASIAVLDGYMQLAAGVVAKATKDLRKRDPLASLDALIWLTEDGPVWLEALGMELTPEQVLHAAVFRSDRRWKRREKRPV